MSRVAIATTAQFDDPEFDLLAAALLERGVTATAAAWDDEGIEWGRFDATVIRSTWDYPLSHARFVAWASAVPNLHNPAPVVTWNSDKRYLEDLARAGVPTIPTTYATDASAIAFPDADLVVKPTVGGGSRGAKRFERHDLDGARAHVDVLAGMGLAAMVQPFVASVATRGETDVIVLDGVVSHAVRKHAPIGLEADATPTGPVAVEPVAPSDDVRAVVAAALAAVPHTGPLCYARIDLVELDGTPAVIEAELIEPFLFLSEAPGAAAALAAAIARRVAR